MRALRLPLFLLTMKIAFLLPIKMLIKNPHFVLFSRRLSLSVSLSLSLSLSVCLSVCLSLSHSRSVCCFSTACAPFQVVCGLVRWQIRQREAELLRALQQCCDGVFFFDLDVTRDHYKIREAVSVRLLDVRR
jgi:hypothetical protein